ncbi:MAG: biotin-dependent carboxyltransferase family protein [Planctomycetota bacterium]
MTSERTIHVRRAGLSTTVQDFGRFHTRHLGVSIGGAMDRVSHELANRLAGNSPADATLEMTLNGDELHWTFDSIIAITGAEMDPLAELATSTSDTNAKIMATAVPCHRPVLIPAGTTIHFRSARRGCRCYLAVAGGLEVPEILGSRSTLTRAALGGHQGRRLQAGDVLSVRRGNTDQPHISESADHTALRFPEWFVRPVDLPPSSDYVECPIRILPGSEFEQLTHDSQERFLGSSFQISSASDRMGYRLNGNRLALNDQPERPSEGTTVGTIQLPPDGHPIMLMADSAPSGGYPRIAHIISADLPLVAQLRPGQRIRFHLVMLSEASTLLREQRQIIDRAMAMMSWRQRERC